jgi:hypothetical protein
VSEFRLPRLPRNVALVDVKTGFPTIEFQRWWQSVVSKIEVQETTQDGLLDEIAEILGLTSDLEAAIDVVEDLADDAQASADAAQAAADGANSVASLTNSGTTGLTLDGEDAGADARIVVSAHTRVYGDGSTLAIAGPVNITGLAYSTEYYVYYDDATRADTTPTYQTTTSEATAAQVGDRHLVGRVMTPAALAAPTNGETVRPPGIGNLEN